MAQVESPRWRLNKKDGKSLFKGLLITAAGAVLIWALNELPNIDFGQYTAFLVPVGAFTINILLKWVTDEKGKLV